MNEIRGLWERFEKSGKLKDYLEFCKARRTEERKRRPDGDEGEDSQSSL